MYSMGPDNHDYYGYDSKINQEGKRIRRLRRTELSAEKLYYSRMRSPHITPNNLTPRQSKDFIELQLTKNKVSRNKNSRQSQTSDFCASKASQFYQKAMNNHKQTENLISNIQSFKRINEYDLKNQSNYQKSKNKQDSFIKDNSKIHYKEVEKTQKYIKPKPQAQSQSSVENYSIKSSKNNEKQSRLKEDQSYFSKIQTKNKSKDMSYLRSSFILEAEDKGKGNDSNNEQDIYRSQTQSQVSKISSSSSIYFSKASQKDKRKSQRPEQKGSRIKENQVVIRQDVKKMQISKISQSSQLNQNQFKDLYKVKNQFMTKKTTETNESEYSNKKEMQITKQKIKNDDKQKNSMLRKDDNEQNKKKMSEIKKRLLRQSQKKQSQINIQLQSELLTSQKSNKILNKKKNQSNYSFEDVFKNIEEHQCILSYLYFFTENTKGIYSTLIKYERYEKLCFLMMKKYYTEKVRLTKCLKGERQNCFKLTEVEIPNQVLKAHLERPQIKQKYSYYLQESQQFYQQLKNEYNRLFLKYPKDKFIKLQINRDTYSKEIMRLLMEELSKIYQQLQNEEIQYEFIDLNEKRVIQIVELMFLISQLSGRPVKKFTLAEQNQDFTQYYEENYERIMETAEFFQKYG